MASRKPSPIKLKDKTAQTMQSPGKVASQGEFDNAVRPSAVSEPHAGFLCDDGTLNEGLTLKL